MIPDGLERCAACGELKGTCLYDDGWGARMTPVAVVTDAALGNVAEKLGSHFVAATIRRFPADQVEAARHWIAEPGATA